MISDVAVKFQEITKFDLYSYFTDYADFMSNQFQDVRAYYSGDSETIDAKYVENLNSLLERSNTLMKLFTTFGPKLGNVGYWELQNYCQDLADTLKKITLLPKYLRTSKTVRGYKPYVQIGYNVGGMSDFRDIAQRLNSEDITEETLILHNDFEEEDYEIDDTKPATVFYTNNARDLNVKTILEEPVGDKVYGKDILSKISFDGDDLAVVEYQDNVEQKIVTLLELIRGDVPELPTFGRKKITGENFNNYSYPELITDIRDIFLQDDLFESVDVVSINIEQGDIFVTLDIRTKYIYSTKRTIKI